MRARGVKSRMCPPYPRRDRKRRLNGAVCRNHRIKRVVPCRCLDGHVKEPYEMSKAWEPDRRSNFFFSPPAHLCAVTYMTEIPLIVTLNNQFNNNNNITVNKFDLNSSVSLSYHCYRPSLSWDQKTAYLCYGRRATETINHPQQADDDRRLI